MMMREAIRKELEAMQKIDIDVPAKAFDLLKSEDLSEYEDMAVSDIADLLCQLAR